MIEVQPTRPLAGATPARDGNAVVPHVDPMRPLARNYDLTLPCDPNGPVNGTSDVMAFLVECRSLRERPVIVNQRSVGHI